MFINDRLSIFLTRLEDKMRPQHNSIAETKWLKRPYFSLENLAIASYYLHFPPQLSPFSLISLSSLNYAEVSK
jgi:hypothetical protein